MKLRRTVLAIIGLLMVGVAGAQEPAAAPAPPPPKDVRLLDEVPNYAEILRHQWSDGVPEDVTQAEQSVEHYGRLLEGPAQATTLAECIALAVQNNTGLQIQRLGPVAATAGVRRARSIFDPRIFADITRNRLVTPATTFLTAGSVTATSLFTQNFNWDAGVRKALLSGGQLSLAWTNNRLVTNPSIAFPVVPLYTTTLGLSLTQPLLRDFGWRYALLIVEVAQTTEQSAYYQYAANIATLVAQVERAYWALVLAIESVHVQEQSLALAQELLRQNQGKFNVGALAHASVLEAQSVVASRESTLIRAGNLRDNARDRLRALINYREPGAADILEIDPQDKPAVPLYAIDLDRSLKSALEGRPELVAARLDIQGKGLQRKIAENQLLPKLNFVGGVGLNGLSGSDAHATFNETTIPVNPSVLGGYGSALDLLPDGRYYNYSAGATVEIPLDNALAKADYSTANIGLEQSRKSLQKLQEDVTLEIKTAVSNLQTDLKSIDATRLARELGEENLRNQQARYDVGLATTKDLLDFQDQLTQARFSEILSLTQYNTDLAEMRRVEGTLLSARNLLIERVSPEKAPWWAQF